MTTSFPTGLDALTNPTGSSSLTSPDHAGQHANANDAIEALEAKVGVNGSAVTSSLDYKITNINASNLASGTVPSARVTGAYTGITSVGTLGSLAVSGTINTSNGIMELGLGRASNGFSYVDLIGDTTYTDYGLRLLRGNGGANTNSQLNHRGTGTLSITTQEAAPLVFGTSNTERMRITSAGNVGIGTSSPSQPLDVNGVAKATQFLQGTDYLSPYQGFRNKIINGDFSIWQRGGTGGYTPTAGNIEGADRWYTWWNGTGGTRSVSRSTFTLGQTAVPNNPKHHMTINTSVIGSGQTVTDFWQKIENVNTFAGQTVTLSFWWKSTSAATQASPFITQNFGTGGSPSAAVNTSLTTTSLASANTWTKYSVAVTLPSISGKTLGTSSDNIMIGMRFLFSVACTIDISSVQLERGSVATPFEQRPMQTELALCQRYFQKSYPTNTAAGTANDSGQYAFYGTSNAFALLLGTIQLRVPMRVVPTTITYYRSGSTNTIGWDYFNAGGGAGSGTPTTVYASETSFTPYLSLGGSSFVGGGIYGHWVASAEL